MNKILRPYTYLLSVHVAALLQLSVIRLFFYIASRSRSQATLQETQVGYALPFFAACGSTMS